MQRCKKMPAIPKLAGLMFAQYCTNGADMKFLWGPNDTLLGCLYMFL